MTAPEAVRAAAQAAPDWDALAASARTCTACPELAQTRTQVVVGAAPAGARLVVMGEAPGAQEDESGLPFVGRSGQLLALADERQAALVLLRPRRLPQHEQAGARGHDPGHHLRAGRDQLTT